VVLRDKPISCNKSNYAFKQEQYAYCQRRLGDGLNIAIMLLVLAKGNDRNSRFA